MRAADVIITNIITVQADTEVRERSPAFVLTHSTSAFPSSTQGSVFSG